MFEHRQQRIKIMHTTLDSDFASPTIGGMSKPFALKSDAHEDARC
jgi:hypothetical protein